MTRALPFRVEVSDADLHGQPGAHMHAEKRDKARLWKDKNTFNCTCCMFVYIQKPSFILRTIFGFFSRKYIPVYLRLFYLERRVLPVFVFERLNDDPPPPPIFSISLAVKKRRPKRFLEYYIYRDLLNCFV